MSEFIIKEEDFKLGYLDKTPVAQENECILLIRKGYDISQSISINEYDRIQGAEIRRGKFNRKVIISLQKRHLASTFKMQMKVLEFYFEIAIEVVYSVKDSRTYYVNKEKNEELEIKNTIKKVVKRNEATWNGEEWVGLENYLEDEIEKELLKMEYLNASLSNVSVTPDSEAQKMIQMEKEKIIGIRQDKNEAERVINKNDGKLKIKSSQDILDNIEINKLMKMAEQFGPLGTIVQEYIKGNISGEQFYEYTQKSKTEELNLVHAANENDLLTQKEAMERTSKILGYSKVSQAGGNGSNEERIKELSQKDADSYSIEDEEYL